MKIEEAYDLMKNRSKCSLAVRLECHHEILRSTFAMGSEVRGEKIADALSDICLGLQLLLGDKAE